MTEQNEVALVATAPYAIRMSTPCDAVATAFVEAGKVAINSQKSGKNNHLKSTYSTLGDVIDAVKAACDTNDLKIIQGEMVTDDLGNIIIETMVLHKTGQWLSNCVRVPVGQKSAQGSGSSLTYARRYGQAALFNIAQEDDDGQAAKGSLSSHCKGIESCEKLEDLEALYKDAYRLFHTEPASLSALVAAKDKRKAELSRGFNPAKLKNEPSPAKPEQVDEPKQAEDFDKF
ncbi:hypothetical protein vBSlqSZDD2_64 [Serratia phage vB_SlqS_ZDD2]|nr:hypothetical protein vBSlqSZDD2_64 [Serratia phage vB_SlqS_ZDD2]